MFRMLSVIAAAFCLTAGSQASWFLANEQLIDGSGSASGLWSGSIGYVVGLNGAVWYYDGEATGHVFGPSTASYDPSHANGVVAWRNYTSTSGRNDIYMWDGEGVWNISSSPALDANVSVGSNGDLLWSRAHTSLWYYDASEDRAFALGVSGCRPSLYVREDGVATYAYQDASTQQVKYFDGTTTHVVGDGASFGAYPSVWDGAVAWIGQGAGYLFDSAELYYWKDGVTTRVTNDDAVNGIPDESPKVWNDMVVWVRSPVGPFSARLFLWAGGEIIQLNSAGRTPSFHGGQVTWVDGGLHLADLVALGACCDMDGGCTQELEADCVGVWAGAGTECDADCDGDGVADACQLAWGWAEDCQPNGVPDHCDIASGFSQDLNGNGIPDECEHYEVGDLNCDGLVNVFDIDPFVLALTDPASYAEAFPWCDLMNGDINGDGLVNVFDIDPFVILLTGGFAASSGG